MLELLVKVENNQSSIQLYDKKDDLFFSVVRIAYLRINIPSKMFYSTYRSEILEPLTK